MKRLYRAVSLIKITKAPLNNNNWLRLLSLSLAIVLWFFVARQELAEMEFGAVPVAFGKLPPNMEMISKNTSNVSVRLRGPRSILATIDSNKIRAKADDFPHEVNEGRVVLSVRPNSVSAPPGVDVIEIDPAQIRVTLEKKAIKEIQIQPTFRGRPPLGYEFINFNVIPRTVRVEAPRSVVENLVFMTTEAIDLSGSIRTLRERVSLSIEKPNVKLFDIERVELNIEIVPKEMDRLVPVKIRLEPPALNMSIYPSEVLLVLRGPELQLRDLRSENVSVVAILDATYEGSHTTPLVVTDLPAGCSIRYLVPDHAKVVIDAMTQATAGNSVTHSSGLSNAMNVAEDSNQNSGREEHYAPQSGADR